MTDQAVRVERSGPVTTVHLHRPARRNAVDGPAAAALAAAFRAFDMILTGRAVGAREAAAIGLANRVPAGQALAAARELAAELAAFPQICLRSDGASVLDQEGLDEAAALAAEFAHGRRALAAEAGPGAARFAGAGRHGSFGP